jgi:hypothetical protein
MSFDPTPWFIGGGAYHSPDVARLLAYVAAGGTEGVAAPPDLKVTANGSGFVTVAPGAASILNRSADGENQAYVTRAPSETLVAVTPTGGSARSDLVVVVIEDPDFAPWQVPDDPVAAQYVFARVIPNVPPNTVDASTLNLGYSAIALARLDIPAGTSNITAGMVHDVRRLGQAHSSREVQTDQPTANVSLTHAGPTFIAFPNFTAEVVVPAWANHASVLAHVTSLGVVGGDTTGQMRVVFGGLNGPGQPFNFEGTAGDFRTTTLVVAEFDVSALAGSLVDVQMSAFRQTGPGALKTLIGTRVIYDINFEQRAT